MSALLAATERSYGEFGLFPMAMFVIAIIINLASWHSKDMNRKSTHATTLLFIALLIESSVWTVRTFRGGSEVGSFWALIGAAVVHGASATIGLFAIREHREVGRWPHGRRRASWGFWLNVIALLILAAWFWLGANPTVYKRIFED